MKSRLIFLITSSLFASCVYAAGFEKIMEKGFIEFAVYENFPPYSYKDENGQVKGVDVDLGKLIAEKMGVKSGFRLFQADESVEDDLRNLVWKGHYLAGGAADVFLHAPYDVNFAKLNEKVIFTQPYFREVVAFAVNTERVRSARTLEVFATEPIGVETASLSDAYLLGAFSGKLRDSVRHYVTVTDAVYAMVDREVSAVMANRGELEHGLLQHEHDFLVTKLPTPGLSVEGWELCAAVSSENVNLANKLNEVIGELKQSGEIESIFKSHGLSYHPVIDDELLLVSGDEK